MRISDWSSDVCSSDLIDVDQRRPDGLAGEIGIERARPPDSARIVRVAPEIGDRLAHHLAGHRDLALVVEDGAGALAVGFEAGAGGDQLVGGRIFLFDPVERLRALDILEPEIGIVVLRRGGCDGGYGTAEGKRGEAGADHSIIRSEEHTSELQSLMRISYAVFCLKKKKKTTIKTAHPNRTL